MLFIGVVAGECICRGEGRPFVGNDDSMLSVVVVVLIQLFLDFQGYKGKAFFPFSPFLHSHPRFAWLPEEQQSRLSGP